MYKVLLVDDEVLIREAISENTKWTELGFTLMGTCKNGKEAVEFIKKDPPDLLLTDIYMPHMDGIELTEYVYNHYPDIKVIIISGYDEFEYAQKAMRFQVLDYILKPVTARELSELLQKVKKKLDEENRHKADLTKIRSAFVRNQPLLQARCLESLLKGMVDPQDLTSKMQEYDITLTGPYYVTALIEGDDVSEFVGDAQGQGTGLAYFSIFNIAEEIMDQCKGGITFQNAEEKTVLIFEGRYNIAGKAMEICEKIQTAIMDYVKIKTTIGLGTVVDSLAALPKSYDETMRAAAYKFQLGTNQVISAGSLERVGAYGSVAVKSYAGKIALAMKQNDEKEIEKNVSEFIAELRKTMRSRRQSILYIQNMIMTILELSGSTELDENMVSSAEKELLDSIFEKEHLSEIGRDIVSFCCKLAENMQEEREDICMRQARMAQNYIEENYRDSSISLHSVCSYLAISTSYFSAIYKKYTGETFVETLTKKRMEKAKQLLETTSKKTYEVAEDVGYSDPHYFSSTFKKITGCTPTEYAKKKR